MTMIKSREGDSRSLDYASYLLGRILQEGEKKSQGLIIGTMITKESHIGRKLE